MDTNITGFTDAIYHKKNRYNFEETIFTRRMLKILLLINGERTVEEVSSILSVDPSGLIPEYTLLAKLGVIQEKNVSTTTFASHYYHNNTSHSETSN